MRKTAETRRRQNRKFNLAKVLRRAAFAGTLATLLFGASAYTLAQQGGRAYYGVDNSGGAIEVTIEDDAEILNKTAPGGSNGDIAGFANALNDNGGGVFVYADLWATLTGGDGILFQGNASLNSGDPNPYGGGFGGGFYVWGQAGSVVSFGNGATFWGNTADGQSGGGGYIASGSDMAPTDIDVTFGNRATFGGSGLNEGNTASLHGGGLAVDASNNADVTFGTEAYFGYNTTGGAQGGYGGGLFVSSGPMGQTPLGTETDNTTVVFGADAVFESNTAVEYGGGAYFGSNSRHMPPEGKGIVSLQFGENLIVSDNTTTNPFGEGHGGGFAMEGITLQGIGANKMFADGTLFTENTTTTHGGGIYANFTGLIDMQVGSNVTFSNNTATGGAGGGIYAEAGGDSNLTFGNDVTFDGNKAISGRGGGIYANAFGDLNLTFGDGVTLVDNTATFNDGGGIYAFSAGLVTVRFGADAVLTGNTAGGDGGAITTKADMGDSVSFGENALVSGNRAAEAGAIYTRHLSFEAGATISDNRAFIGNGGAGFVSQLNIKGGTKITDNYAAGDGGAFFIEGGTDAGGNAYVSTLNATGGDIVFSGNKSGVNFADPNNPVDGLLTEFNSLFLNSDIDLQLTGDGNIYFDDPINSAGAAGNITLTKTGDGFVQFRGGNHLNSFGETGGAVNVDKGTFRVAAATFYAWGSDAVFTLADGATLAGGGSIAGAGVSSQQGFVIYGTISPDSAVLLSTNSDEANEQLLETNKFGNLGLVALGPIILNGFEYVYDADTAVADTTDSNATTGDLLVIMALSGIQMGAGTVELRGDLAEGYYHLITAVNDITDLSSAAITDLNAVLTAKQDGKAVEPRWTTEFVWGNNGADKTNLWLGTTRNTLSMNFTGIAAAADWNTTDANWESDQSTGTGATLNRSTKFNDGDYVKFDPTAAQTIDITDAVNGVKVSGFEFAGTGTITFTGGGITMVGAGDPDFKGDYIGIITPNSTLQKSDTSTLVFDNAANGFTGIDTSGGTIAFNNVDQLGTGTIAFTGNAALRADAADMTLARPVTIANGTTATFNTQGNTLTLSGAITGVLGTVAKDGAGRLILTNNGSNYQNTTVNAGTLETHYVAGLGSSGVNLVAADSVLDFNLQTFNGETYDGQITGAGAVKVRGRNLTLTHANNTYSGGTTVDGVELTITHAAHGTNAGSVGTGDIVLSQTNSRLDIQLAENGELANDISGAGWLRVDNPGQTLTLSGNNSYDSITIADGKVVIGSDTALGSGWANFYGDGTSLISNLEQTIANTIQVYGSDTTLHATGHLTVAGAIASQNSFYLQDDSSLTVNAADANILAEKAVYSVFSNAVLNKAGSGTFQVAADSNFQGTVNVNEGDFRVVDGKTFGAAASILNLAGTPASASISGNGAFVGTTATLGGTIDPTGKKFASDGTETGSDYATLWLRYGTVTLDGFTLLYDVVAPNTANDPGQTTNDLLQIVGETKLGGGTVDVRTQGGADLALGRYLVVHADRTILDENGLAFTDNAALNAVLTATLNGNGLADESPRGTMDFTLEDYNPTQSQIWLVSQINSLTMDWTGGDGTWNATDANFTSLQTSPAGTVREHIFLGGDKVHFADADDITVTLNDAVTVSGLVVGQTGAGTDENGDVTISGTGSITADAASAFGKYVNDGLTPTGILQKFDTGTLAVENTGGNRFEFGTDLNNGKIVIGDQKALDETNTAGSLNGHVRFTGNVADTRTVEVADTVESIKNHFRVLSGSEDQNTFRNLGALEISGVTNNVLPPGVIGPGIPDYSKGGVFYVDTNRGLTIDVQADLTLSGNSYRDAPPSTDPPTYPTANDIYLMTGSTLNVNVADGTGMFIGSGIRGEGELIKEQGTIVLNGSGPDDNDGFLQIAANSYVANADVQSGRLRMADNRFLSASEVFTLAAGASFEGKGYLYADTGSVIQGIVSPDAAKFTSGTDTVGAAEKIGVLHFQGGNTHFDGFTFQYDVVAANTTKAADQSPNDLIQLASQPAYIQSGTVNFRTADADTPLGVGNYLVIDSNATKFYDGTGAHLLDNTTLNTVLSGQINGEAFETFGPRNSHDFYFDTNNMNADSQIWLGVSLNSLTMDWTGGSATWNDTASNFRSLQTGGNGTARESVFRNGDKVHLATDIALDITLNDAVTVSGLVVGQASATGSPIQNGDVTITDTGGITTDAASAFGKHLTEAPLLTPTGKLEKYGTGTLTFTNIGGNTFANGIDLYGGTLAFNRANQLTVDDGKSITFKDDATLQTDATTALTTDIYVDPDITATIHTGVGIVLLAENKIASASDSDAVLNKTGEGTVQAAADFWVDTLNVNEGAVRVVDGTEFYGFTLYVAPDARLEGSGRFGSYTSAVSGLSTAMIEGTIDPTSKKFDSDGNETGSDIGTIYLYYGTTALDGFTLLYDAVAPNGSADPFPASNDLLTQNSLGRISIVDGTINFRTGSAGFTSGSYLVIHSNFTDLLDGTGAVLTTDVLRANVDLQLNGVTQANASPRGTLKLEVRGYDGVTAAQVWVAVQRNTLEMLWQGADGVWTTAGNWQSVQTNGTARETTFNDGDFVRFGGENYTVTLSGDVLVSGLDADNAGVVTISGDYGITAKRYDADLIVGKYANTADPQGFDTTGKLEKFGAGTLTLANTGGNLFEEGIGLHGGILSYNNANQLGVGAGEAISFKNVATLRADATTYLNTDLVVDDGVTGILHADSGVGMLVASTITGDVTSALNKTGAGLVQLETDSTAFDGTTNVNGGTFRVLAGNSFGSGTQAVGSALNVNATGTIAGAGTFTGNSATISGTIDPTGVELAVDGNESDDVHATLTLSYDTVTLDGFTLLYDVVAPNTASDPGQTTNDLLQIVGETKLGGGTIDVRTQGGADLAHGRYLVVHADRTILDENGLAFTDNAALNAVLTATLNGNGLADESPRGTMDFTLEDYNPTQSQIWLVSQINSLTMDWTGGDGTWNVTDANFTSLQTSPDGTNRATQFLGGDKVHLAGIPASSVTINAPVTVSGLVVGQTGAGNTLDGDVTISGTGSITSDADEAFGKYVDNSLIPTGKLEKFGTGTLTLANTGGNTFESGIEITAGTLAFDRTDQLGVGIGNFITFKGAATLRADATARLDTDLVVDDGVTGTLHTDLGVGMLVDSTISGGVTSALNKTGTGLVQLETDSTAFDGTTDVNGGTFRVLGGNSFGSAAKRTDSTLNVGRGGTIAGAGTFTGNSATISGTIDPTGIELAVDGSESGDAHATLTLFYDTVTLDGFTLMFDGDTNYDTAGTKDLLVIEATTVVLVGGAVRFSSLISGRHLIIDATSEIAIDPAKELDGIDNPDGVLTALNSAGNKIKNDTVRGRLEFVYGNDKKQVWADAKRNSLAMRNVGTGFESIQGDDGVDGRHKARTIVNGDTLVLSNDSTIMYVFNANDWQLAQFAVEGDGDVGITGTGGLLTSDALTATEGEYVGITGPDALPVTGKFLKSGIGTVTFSNTGANVFGQGVEIDGGALDIRTNLSALYLNIGDTAKGTTAVLSGTGSIAATGGTAIASGSTLRPGGLSNDYSQIPSAEVLNVFGDLTFEAGSIHDVGMTMYMADPADETFTPVSDCVVVDGGTVAIASGALLDVAFDYWNNTIFETDLNSRDTEAFTIIDATAGDINDVSETFTLNDHNLPLGVTLAQGWIDGRYQLWFENDPTKDFENLCPRHNRSEIGRILDEHVRERNTSLKDLINHLSDGFSNKEVCELLDQLTGDLRTNSLMTALSQPWRYSFRQLDRDRSSGSSRDPCAAACNTKTGKRQLWGETFGRYDDADSDGNAHGYTINRWGVAVGVDQRISSRALIGFSFDYSNPILRQATGRTDVDNYGFGGYGYVRLNDRYDMKFHVGYSHQSYEIDRNVYIPETRRFAALNERFRNTSDGDTFATSLELSRTFKMNRRFSLAPLLALDYERARMDGYRESGGLTALKYDRSSVERFMFRFGLDVGYKFRKNLDLNAGIQYGTQLNDKEYAFGDVRFVNSTLDDPMSGDIHGVRLGRDYLNLGIGADWKLNTKRNMSLFVNYDADIYRRATMHVGQFGLAMQW